MYTHDTAMAMTEPVMPSTGAAVSDTPQPLAALIQAMAGTPGIIAMVNEQAASDQAAQNRCHGMLHSLNSGRASGMSANMATNMEMPAYVRMAPTPAMPSSTRYGLFVPTLPMMARAMDFAAPDLSMYSPRMAAPMKMSRFFCTNPASPVTYDDSPPTMAAAMSMPLVSAMMMAVTMDVTSTFHPFMAAMTKNTSPTTMPATPIHSIAFPFRWFFVPPTPGALARALPELSYAMSLRVARMNSTTVPCFMRSSSRRTVPSSKEERSSGLSKSVPRSPRWRLSAMASSAS